MKEGTEGDPVTEDNWGTTRQHRLLTFPAGIWILSRGEHSPVLSELGAGRCESPRERRWGQAAPRPQLRSFCLQHEQKAPRQGRHRRAGKVTRQRAGRWTRCIPGIAGSRAAGGCAHGPEHPFCWSDGVPKLFFGGIILHHKWPDQGRYVKPLCVIFIRLSVIFSAITDNDRS